MTTSTFVIASESAELPRVRAWLCAELTARGFDAREQWGLQVAVGEITSNSIKHAYEGRAGQPIRLSVESRDDSVVIQIEDFGRQFDASRYRDPNLDEMNEAGMGLFIAKQLADELSFDLARERGTRWILIKRKRIQSERSA